ncbi:MAG: S49 family peptidase [Candidatus Krumholzibacteriia bacterium]
MRVSRPWLLVFVTFSLMGLATPGIGQVESSIPSYYSHLQFNLTSPTARAAAIGGFANPAVYGMMPGPEAQFSWSDRDNRFRTLKEWGLFVGTRRIGFGMVRNEIPLPGGGEAGVNDMRIGFVDGTRNTTVGLGYGWSTGDDELLGRSNVFQAGVVQRVGRHLSIGVSGNFAIEKSNQVGLFDIAVRPIGDERLTVFADAELPKGVAASDVPWSVGTILEPIPGIQLTGRFFDDDSYAFSAGFSFGGLRLSASPRFDKNNNTTNTTYEIRSGYFERSVFDDVVLNDSGYLRMDLKGKVKYRGFRYFDSETHPLFRILRDLENARNDAAIRGVALNLSGARMSHGKAWEIRDKLAEVRAKGKHVVIFADELGMTQYHLASVADRLVMDPEGLIEIPGYVMTRTYLRDLLEKIGLGFDEWRFLEYKSAAETFSRRDMSEADREQRQELLDDIYATVRRDVASSRAVSEDTFDEWVDDEIVLDSRHALELGLVDTLGRWEDVAEVIAGLEGSKKRYFGRRSLAAERIPSRRWGEDKKIAIVYALGVCAMDSGIHARKLEKIFQGLRDDRSVAAVVFRIDSPGGSGLASDVAAAAMRKCAEKKPVIVSQGDVAASGGYWLSMYGTEIYAQPTTITGSIGIIGGWVWNDGIGEKLGHASDHVRVGEHADALAGIRLLLAGPRIPDRNLLPDERRKVIDTMKDAYDGFVGKVAAGRNMSTEDVGEVAAGRVFSGWDARSAGLVDRIGGLEAAVRAARTAAGIHAGEAVAFVEYPKMPAFDLSALRPGVLFRTLFRGSREVPRDVDDEPEWSYVRALIGAPGRPLFMLPPGLRVDDGGRP